MYHKSLSSELREYFNILLQGEEYPIWLEDYIATPEVQRAKGIHMACGCQFLEFWDAKADYNILEHSVACSLMVWHFTHDKIQTIATLFHDISNPAFKHCIDVYNGDALTQESTESPTKTILVNSKPIQRLLHRDGIATAQVCDYHLYPIADNDTPKLSSDRLEYTFMNSHKIKDYNISMPLSKIKKFYDNLTIGKNENNQPEMAFKNYKIAEEFIDTIHPLWHNWLDNRFQITSRAYATIIERAIEAKDFTYEELFKLTDQEAVAKILNSNNKKLRQDFKKFCKTKQFHKGNKKPTENKFIVPAFPVKVRYIDPLFSSGTKYQRLSSASKKAKQYINEIKDYPVEQYA